MKNIKKIIFCAERPDGGPTGGAAGVMYLLRKYLDVSNVKCKIEYLYRNGKRRDFVWTLIKDAIKSRDTYYICHEPDAASILAMVRKKYCLVYHQQGPIVQEYINHTDKPSKLKIIKKKIIEKLAFKNAEKVFFPSRGAANEYFNSQYATVKPSQVKVGEPLYNTINIDEEKIALKEIIRDDTCLTFLSVGTMSELKGQDISFKLISEVVRKTEKKIRWITVGDGLIKKKVSALCAKLSKNNSNFEYIHFDKIPHSSVLYLDSIADVYIMLHRSSIFDLATLEAMNNKCVVVLSKIGGNLDFNAKDNIILVDLDELESGANRLIKSDMVKLKEQNKKVFDDYFSPEKFSERYKELITTILLSYNN